MTEEKRTRKMSAKWFLSLATGGKKSVSAEAFIAAHRSWLETGELAAQVAPILIQIDDKEIFPTPGLDAIKMIALGHLMAENISKAEEQLNKVSEPRTEKPYVGCIMTSEGKIAMILDEKKEQHELRSSFEHPQEAERWCQRRLNESATDWYGEVIWTKILTKDKKPMVTKIRRDDAIKAIIPKTKSPLMHYNKVGGGGRLSNRMSVGQTHVRFSRG